MMVSNPIYRRTAAGDRALKSERSVPDWFRAVLVLVAGLVSSGAICGGMPSHSQKQVLNWIDQLETLGFIERMILPPSPIADAIPMEPNIGEGWEEEIPLLPAEAAMAITAF
jgi:hypothetical protein